MPTKDILKEVGEKCVVFEVGELAEFFMTLGHVLWGECTVLGDNVRELASKGLLSASHGLVADVDHLLDHHYNRFGKACLILFIHNLILLDRSFDLSSQRPTVQGDGGELLRQDLINEGCWI